LNYHYVGDALSPDREPGMCNTTYYFYVKHILQRFDYATLTYTNETYLDDKIYQLDITFRKIGANFEYMGGNLFDEQNGTVQRLK